MNPPWSLVIGDGSSITRHLPYLFHEHRDQFLFPDFFDDLSLFEKHPYSPSSRYSDVRFGGFSGTVHDATHKGDLQGGRHPLQFPFYPFYQTNEMDFAASAGRTGDDIRTDIPDVQRPQYPVRHADLMDGTAGDGNAYRVSDAFIQEDSDADGGFDRRLDESSRLCHAEMQRMIRLLGNKPVSVDCGRYIGGFQGKLDGVKAQLFHEMDIPHGALHKSPCGWSSMT